MSNESKKVKPQEALGHQWVQELVTLYTLAVKIDTMRGHKGARILVMFCQF
jgi:hypothetical protein